MHKSITLSGMMVFLCACLPELGADKDLSDMEEPSSEPAEEPSDSTNDDSDSSNDSGDSGSDGDSDDRPIEPSNEPSDDDIDDGVGYLNPDILLFTFRNGYADGGVTGSTVDSAGIDLVGSFSLILFDSMNDDYCVVDWTFDETTVAPDAAYSDGYVTNGFYGTDVEVWYGYLILSRPTTRESCDSLTPDWLLTLDQIKADRPGFGYGPLTEDLMTSMETEGYVSWDLLSDIVFTGIPSMTVFGDGQRMYFPVNQGFAYQLDSDGSTQFDSTNQDMPQGTELSASSLPSDGFYVGHYYFGISLDGH